jgi:hypothetical protein
VPPHQGEKPANYQPLGNKVRRDLKPRCNAKAARPKDRTLSAVASASPIACPSTSANDAVDGIHHPAPKTGKGSEA